MKKFLKLMLMIVLMLINLPSCSNSSGDVPEDMENEFQAIFPNVEMNKAFLLKVESNEKTHKFGSDIPLSFKNQSNDTIYFPTDSFIKIFAVSNGQWIELKNKNTYSGNLVLAPQGTPLMDDNFTGVRPELPALGLDGEETAMLIRIVLVGEILVDEVATGQLVGSFIDVQASH
jgi:hypothetical protein